MGTFRNPSLSSEKAINSLLTPLSCNAMVTIYARIPSPTDPTWGMPEAPNPHSVLYMSLFLWTTFSAILSAQNIMRSPHLLFISILISIAICY